MSDALWDGRRSRTFNVVDDYNREALAIEIDLSLPSPRVVHREVKNRVAEGGTLNRMPICVEPSLKLNYPPTNGQCSRNCAACIMIAE